MSRGAVQGGIDDPRKSGEAVKSPPGLSAGGSEASGGPSQGSEDVQGGADDIQGGGYAAQGPPSLVDCDEAVQRGREDTQGGGEVYTPLETITPGIGGRLPLDPCFLHADFFVRRPFWPLGVLAKLMCLQRRREHTII